MSRLTKHQIQQIIKRTPDELKGTYPHIREVFGIFTVKDANWSFIAGWTDDGKLVVTRYGEVL